MGIDNLKSWMNAMLWYSGLHMAYVYICIFQGLNYKQQGIVKLIYQSQTKLNQDAEFAKIP